MGTITDSAYNQSPTPGSHDYSVSVPLSVYRELAAELQAAQTAIHQLHVKNEYLAQENYLLRQEIAKTVNAVLHLQNAVNSPVNPAQNNTSYNSFHQTSAQTNQKRYTSQNKQYKRQNIPKKRVKRPRTSPPARVTEFVEPLPETIFIEEEEANYYYTDSNEISQVSSWWLIFAIFLIIFMGFGAGYIVVRPLLENHTR